MTLIVSWLGVDSRGPASIYLASDSRISWGENSRWDNGRKVFGFKNHPDLLGYCGDVLFPSQVLSQIITLGDEGLLFCENSTCKQKFEAIKEKFVQIFQTFPYSEKSIIGDYLAVIHASRDNKNNFSCHVIEWYRGKGWSGRKLVFSDHSNKLIVLGSGRDEFLVKYEKYWHSSNKKTSRALFHCLCDTLSNIKDSYCGGAPQLVGLYRIENARNYGIIYNKRRYFLGVDISNLNNFNIVEWRNELFERCDGETMKILPKAQKQPNPFLDKNK